MLSVGTPYSVITAKAQGRCLSVVGILQPAAAAVSAVGQPRPPIWLGAERERACQAPYEFMAEGVGEGQFYSTYGVVGTALYVLRTA